MVAPSWQHDTRYAELLSRFWNYYSYPKHYCSSSPSPQPCEGPVWRYETCVWFSNFDKVRIQMQFFKATQRTITISHNGIVLTKAVMKIVAQLDDIRSTSIKWILDIINLLEYRMNALVRWSWQRAGREGCVNIVPKTSQPLEWLEWRQIRRRPLQRSNPCWYLMLSPCLNLNSIDILNAIWRPLTFIESESVCHTVWQWFV